MQGCVCTWEEQNLKGLKEPLGRPKRTISCTWGRGMTQVPTLQQNHTTAIKGTHTNEQPLAVRPIGIGHSRTLPHCHTAAQVPRRKD